MAEGELKDMEQFFDDLSDSFSGTEPEVHKTSVVGKQLIPMSHFGCDVCHRCDSLRTLLCFSEEVSNCRMSFFSCWDVAYCEVVNNFNFNNLSLIFSEICC